jgi:excinuclease UvrABC nuclease subunit
MSKNFTDYGNDVKRIVFKVTDHEHAKLIVRLRHNALTQSEFFKAVIDAVNHDDELILSFIQQHISEKKKMNKERIVKTNKMIDKGKQIIKDFSLSDDEVEDVFDLIAEEFPEL